MILFYRFLCINFWDSEQINCVNLWLGKQAIGFIFPIHYSEQINCVNLWLGKQAIGFIFPIHYSEQINNLNLWLDKQAIGFIFPIHYQNKLTTLICGLTSKPSDLSFRFTIRTFNFIESHTSCVRFIFRFNKKRKTSPPNPFFFRNTKGVETVLFEHISTKCVTQHINKSTEEGVFIYKTFSVN